MLTSGSLVEASLKRMDGVCGGGRAIFRGVLIGVGAAVAVTGVTTPALALSPSRSSRSMRRTTPSPTL